MAANKWTAGAVQSDRVRGVSACLISAHQCSFPFNIQKLIPMVEPGIRWLSYVRCSSVARVSNRRSLAWTRIIRET